MQDDNPYAAPKTNDPEPVAVFSGNHWRVYSETLIAHHGATLPRVDLETGETGQQLRPIRHAPGRFKSWRWLMGGSDPSIQAFAGRRTRITRIRCAVFSKIIDFAILALIFLPNFRSEGLLALLVGLALLNFDTPRLKIEPSAKPGWLRITGAHPDALAHLRATAKSATARPSFLP